MNRINQLFSNRKKDILSIYFCAGYPTLEGTVETIKTLEKNGVQMIEIGIPFSDPIAEGPVIQEANIRALSKGMTTDQVFEIVIEVRKHSNIPLCLMTYLNPVFHYGYDEFFKKCQETGVDGIIIPDCPYEESKEVSDICYKYDVDLISMIAPTSKERTLEIAAQAKGFIYLVSSMGVTGMRSNIVTDIEGIVESIKTVTDTPVAVGFGINSPAQVKHFGNIADGVIVGSAIVNLIKEHGDRAHQPLFNYIQTLIKEL